MNVNTQSSGDHRPATSAAKSRSDAEQSAGASDTSGAESAVFAALFSAVQSGYGAGMRAAQGNASSSRAFSAPEAAGRQGERIRNMTAEARAEVRASGNDRPGPREARLEDAHDTRALRHQEGRRGEPAPRSWQATQAESEVNKNRSEEVRPVAQPSVKASPLLGDEARVLDARAARTVNPIQPGQGGSPPASAESSVAQLTPAGRQPTVTKSPAVSGQVTASTPVAASGKTAPTVAQQIAQLLSARAEATAPVRGAIDSAAVRSQVRAGRSAASRPEGTLPQAKEPSSTVRTAFEKLVRNVRMTVGTRQSSARIRLHPPELGTIRVDVKVVDSHLDVRVEAQNPVARELIGERLELLRAALLDHGLIPERLELAAPKAGSFSEGTGTTEGDNADGRDGAPTSEKNHDDNDNGLRVPHEADATAPAEEYAEPVDSSVAVLDARLDIHI
ncbi:MAG: hypothetical protein GY842_20515 [bacterium]|nr:hypothetical protein [bacterium]